MAQKTQIVIVGSGVVGAAIAYELSANPEWKITLIDKNIPASGSTGAALGVLMAVISGKTRGRGWKLRQNSLKRYQTLLPDLEKLTNMTIPCNRQGILRLYSDQKETAKWLKLSQERAKQGYNLEIWNPEQIQRQCPHLNLEKVVGAIYSPQDLQVNPIILTKALVSAASLRGVDCKFGEKVDKLLTVAVDGSNNFYCNGVETRAETIKADWVILAAGLGSTALIPSLPAKVTINPVLGQALLLKSNQVLGNPQFQPVITKNDVHIVPVGRGEYWVGATVEFPQEKGHILSTDEELLAQVHREAIAFCPALAGASVMLSWSGKRPRPEGRSAPVIEKLSGYDNIILATGHYRNGVLLAPATASAVDKIITEN
jgi:glycine/D-amino acid oxidase-like deaminating enzyme